MTWVAVGEILGRFATKPLEAEPGTIHGSDAPETAEFEIGLWFTAAELSDWTPADQVWRQEG